jgi:hypothetical protein
MKVAILHWGKLNKTVCFTETYKSHKTFMYEIFDKNNITYDIFIHSWADNITEGELQNIPIKKMVLDDQSKVIDNIDKCFSDYFYEDVYKENGGDSLHEWVPDMVKRCLYGLESKKRVTHICNNGTEEYDYVIYLRPDIILTSYFPCEIFNKIIKDTICVLPNHWGGKEVFGINNVFAITRFDESDRFGTMIDTAKWYRKNVGRLAAEHFFGWIVKNKFKYIITCDTIHGNLRGTFTF